MKRSAFAFARRRAALGLAAAVFALAAWTCGPAPASSPPAPAAATNNEAAREAASKEALPKKKLMKNKWFDVELTGDYYMDTRLLFMLSTVWNRTADVGEVLDVAVRLRPTSELSWYREWYAAAERVRAIGDEAYARGHRTSAGEAYLRAANYYLASEVFLHTDPSDPRILEAYRRGGGEKPRVRARRGGVRERQSRVCPDESGAVTIRSGPPATLGTGRCGSSTPMRSRNRCLNSE